MIPSASIQQLVKEIFEEESIITEECALIILKNLERNIERSGNDKVQVGKLLAMSYYIQSEILRKEENEISL
ncbi:MAG: hypothetical protein KI790_05535 [Cyclobacteriaceae bacterium]|nr:hypothetical protein [Cyclobacteriaceae bacterium HetDA_MAG_MS6]